MKLEQLLEGVPFTLVQGSLETEISDIIYDSRKAAPGLLFVCIVGTQRDSHEFAADCAAKGISALVIQHDIDLSAVPGVTVVKVESSRYAMALMSGNLFGNPSRKMTMIGVTGTKGKTTTTHMIKSVLEAAGRKVGMIGTNGIYYMGRHKDTANTTPESYELQKTFREFLDAGCDTALMEVSSQGLMMDRVAGVHYDVGVFTNLSPDHIGPGEHKTFEEYRSWKGQLFRRCDVGVVNIDDENTEALLEGHTCKLVTYGRSEKADYRAEGCELLRTHDFLGVAFHVSGRDNMDVRVNMPGEFSVYNALAALAVGAVGMVTIAAVHGGIQLFQGKPSADILGDLLVIAACSFAGIVFISILFPIFYKFGVNKSRLIMILAFAIPSALVGAGMALLGESGVTLRFSPVFLRSLPFLLIAIVLLGLWLSVSISTRILENKEY